MKVRSPRRSHAFTLIETVGALAVIAILSSLLVPTTFQAITNARAASALVDYRSLKTAVVGHYGKFLSLASNNGAGLSVAPSAPYTNYNGVLLAEGMLEKPFGSKLGTGAMVQLVNISGLSASTSPDGSNGAYDLSGTGKNDVTGGCLVEAVIFGVSQADARALNNSLDGPDLGEPGSSDHDFLGRVIYARPHGGGTLFEVHIYVLHQ
jgi:type II secretory pathway pseudopilin PulG